MIGSVLRVRKRDVRFVRNMDLECTIISFVVMNQVVKDVGKCSIL